MAGWLRDKVEHYALISEPLQRRQTELLIAWKYFAEKKNPTGAERAGLHPSKKN